MGANEKNLLTPDMATLFQLKLENALVDTNCISLGTIQSFNSALQTAEISINYKRKVGDEYIEYPLLVDCPVVFLTGGVARLTFPVAQGDTCLVLFCDRDIDTWFDSGQVTEPNSRRIHSLNDGIAIVGIRSKLNPIENFNTVIASLIDKTGERLVHAGMMNPYAGTTAPSGWLMCYGQAVSRETYDVLFDVIGTTFGVGDGATTFNLPDYRGRGFRGLDNMGGSQANVLTSSNTPNRNTLGGAVGEEMHQLTVPELAAHEHADTASSITGLSGSGIPVYWEGTRIDGETVGEDKPHNNIPVDRMCNVIIKY